MNDFDTEMRRICTYHSDEGTSGYCLSEEQFARLKQLIASKVPEKQRLADGYDAEEAHVLGLLICGYNAAIEEFKAALGVK